jgi:hypothetical protein
MKEKKNPKRRTKTLEQEYRRTFVPYPLPFQGVYTDEDSLEQPSALEQVPTISSPFVEA